MMKSIPIAFVAALIATAAAAQTTTSQPPAGSAPATPPSNAMTHSVNPTTGAMPATGPTDGSSGTAAASGDHNQAVATTDANAPQPARGANSFSRGEARRRIQSQGFQKVSSLHKDSGGVWRGRGSKDGQPVHVWLDYKGNVGQQ